ASDETTTQRGTYVLISIDGKQIGWIDKTGLDLYPVLSTKNTNYQAKVTKPWSINTQPWGTAGAKQLATGEKYMGQLLEVTQEKTTNKSIYALLSLNNKEIGWMDVTGLE